MSFDIPYITPSYTTHYLRTPGNEILDMPIQIIIILTATHKTTHTHKYKKKQNSKYSTSLVIKDMQN